MSHLHEQLNTYAEQNGITPEQAVDALVQYAFDTFDDSLCFKHTAKTPKPYDPALDELMLSWLYAVKKAEPFTDVLGMEKPHKKSSVKIAKQAVDYIEQKMHGDFYFAMLGVTEILWQSRQVYRRCGKQGIATLIYTLYGKSDRHVMAVLMQILLNLKVHDMKVHAISAHKGYTADDNPLCQFDENRLLYMGINDPYLFMHYQETYNEVA